MKYALGNMLNGAGGLNADQLALDLQFAADKTLTARKGPSPILTRGTTATFVGSNGLIQTAVVNAARFDHDPVTLESKGLLIEEGRTNNVTQSGSMNLWGGAGGSTRAVSTQDSPDGTKATIGTTGSSSFGAIIARSLSNLTSTIGTQYTASCFVKKDNWRYVSVDYNPLRPSGANVPFFDLDTLTFNSNGSTTTGIITSYPNGWYRLAVSGAAISAASAVLDVILTTSTGSSNASVGGLVAYVWGAQLEAGSFPTSYIPTTTTALPRNADVCGITGASSTFGNTDGTLFTVGGSLFISTTTNNNICSIESGTTGQLRIFTRAAQAGRLSAMVSNVILTPSSGYNTAGVFYKAAVAANASGADYVIDGTQIPDTYTGSSITADNLKITGVSGTTTNSWISSIQYYKKRLPVSKLQTITRLVSDSDANAYIVALRSVGTIATTTQQNAINSFFESGKAEGWYSQIKRLYLPIWGVQSPNAICMMSLTSGSFATGVTHASGYVSTNGTTGYFLFDQAPASLGLTTSSGSIYCLVTGAAAINGSTLLGGCQDSVNGSRTSFSTATLNNRSVRVFSATALTYAETDSRSVLVATRTTTTTNSSYKRTSSGFVTTINEGSALSPSVGTVQPMAYMSNNNNGTFTAFAPAAAQFGAYGMGLGMTSAQAENFSNRLKTLWETCTGLALP